MNLSAMKLKWVIAIIAFVLAGSQFIMPQHSNPAVDEAQTLQRTTSVPPEVLALFDRSCTDCHSNNTDWRWYTYIAPVSWYTVDHVNEGRRKLNFSVWGTYNAHKQDNKLKAICEQCQRGEMPLTSYAMIHPQTKISADDIRMICEWVTKERNRLSAEQR